MGDHVEIGCRDFELIFQELGSIQMSNKVDWAVGQELPR